MNFARDRDFLEKLVALRNRYGDVVLIDVPTVRRRFLVAHPDHVKHVLVDHFRNYGKAPAEYDAARRLAGNGLITTNDKEIWRRHRRLLSPVFQDMRGGVWIALMVDEAQAMVERWEQREAAGEQIDMWQEMGRTTLRVASRALFDFDLTGAAAEVNAAFLTTLDLLPLSILTPPLWLPTPKNLRFRAARNRLDRILEGIVAQRRGLHTGQRDVVQILLEEEQKAGDAAHSREVRDELVTMVLAGHETTAVTLTWASYLLSRHPDLRRGVLDEVDRVLEGRVPGPDDLERLVFTRAVLQETLRLYPPVWAVVRDCGEDDVIGGYAIRAGEVAIVSAYVTHRHPDFWDNPEGFDPQRFLSEDGVRHPYAYFPFLAGPRKCMGVDFAMAEALVILSLISQRFRLDVVPGFVPKPTARLTLRPLDGLPMQLKKR